MGASRLELVRRPTLGANNFALGLFRKGRGLALLAGGRCRVVQVVSKVGAAR